MANCIYLFSSNSRLRYFEDCLHALMLPREMTLHFRYRVEHLDPALVTELQNKSALQSPVVVSYLFQDYDGKNWTPARVRPLRIGKLLEATIDGPTVHLYFSVAGYPAADVIQEIGESALKALRKGPKPYYASLGDTLPADAESTEDTDAKSFIAVVENLEEGDLRGSFSGDGKIEQIDPLFVRVEGLYKKGGLVTPTKVGQTERERGYKVDFDDPLDLRIRYHQPKWSKADTKQYALTLDVDRDHFAVPIQETIHVASPYDTANFTLLPLRGTRDWLSRISLTSKSSDGVVGELARFAALTRGTARTPTFLTASFEALSPLVAILLAGVSTVIALQSKANANGASTLMIPSWIWIVWALAAIIVCANGVIKFRNR